MPFKEKVGLMEKNVLTSRSSYAKKVPDTFDIFHDKVWAAILSRSCIIYVRNIRMIQESQGLPFSLETGNNLLGIHAGFNDFQCNSTLYRPLLFG
jgi:hypothetical protein